VIISESCKLFTTLYNRKWRLDLPWSDCDRASCANIHNRLLDEDDYYPVPDRERFPRQDLHFPTAENNPLGAWAWR
jgi:hypothetical protein